MRERERESWKPTSAVCFDAQWHLLENWFAASVRRLQVLKREVREVSGIPSKWLHVESRSLQKTRPAKMNQSSNHEAVQLMQIQERNKESSAPAASAHESAQHPIGHLTRFQHQVSQYNTVPSQPGWHNQQLGFGHLRARLG